MYMDDKNLDFKQIWPPIFFSLFLEKVTQYTLC